MKSFNRIIIFTFQALIMVLVLFSCAPTKKLVQENSMDYPDSLLSAPLPTAGKVIAEIKSMEKYIVTIKSKQKILLLDRNTGKLRRAKGFIAFQKPDSYRIQFTTVMGITVMDMMYRSNDLLIGIPQRNKVIDKNSQEFSEFKDYFPFEYFPSIFIPDLSGEHRVLKAVKSYYLLSFFTGKSGGLIPEKDIWIDPETLLVARIDYYLDGFIKASFHYDDYRPVDNGNNMVVYLPYKSEIHLPMKKVSIYMKTSMYKLNSVFPPEMFQLEPRPGTNGK